MGRTTKWGGAGAYPPPGSAAVLLGLSCGVLRAARLWLVVALAGPCSAAEASESAADEASGKDRKAIALDDLRATDPLVRAAAEFASSVVRRVAGARSPANAEIVVFDAGERTADLPAIARTPDCRTVIEPAGRAYIVCNARALYEAEAAIRSFLTGANPPTEKWLLSLGRAISADPRGYLDRIRKQLPEGRDRKAYEAQVLTHLKLLLLFYVAHEWSHVAELQSERGFASELAGPVRAETRVQEAVVKMCRHAEEFHREGFRLVGFEDAAKLTSDLRKKEIAFRDVLEFAYDNTTRWYDAESRADGFAAGILNAHFGELSSRDPLLAREAEHLFIGSLYFTAIYDWYRDLGGFGSRACRSDLTGSSALVLCMMQDRDRYVDAAAVFGATHRFSILRFHRTIESVIEARTDFFKQPETQRTIWVTREHLLSLGRREAMLAFWHYSNLQKLFTLAILMDTPVKFAAVGCATGWMQEIDKSRGTPQLLMMTFEPFSAVVERLTRLP